MVTTKYNKHKTRKQLRRRHLFDFGINLARRTASFVVNVVRRNIYYTLADMKGDVLLVISARSVMLDRKRRRSFQVLEIMSKKIINFAKRYHIRQIQFYPKVARRRMFVRTALRIFSTHRISVTSVFPTIPVPHNGMRARKRRRL